MRRFWYEEIRPSQTCGYIFLHSSMQISFNLARFLGFLWWTCFFNVPQRFSIGLRSGDLLGHWRTLVFFLVNRFDFKLAVSFGSLTCWNVSFRLPPCIKIWWCMAPSIFPSTLWSAPLSCAEKQPQVIILPHPCFTVGMVFFGSYAVPFFLQTWGVALDPIS